MMCNSQKLVVAFELTDFAKANNVFGCNRLIWLFCCSCAVQGHCSFRFSNMLIPNLTTEMTAAMEHVTFEHTCDSKWSLGSSMLGCRRFRTRNLCGAHASTAEMGQTKQFEMQKQMGETEGV